MHCEAPKIAKIIFRTTGALPMVENSSVRSHISINCKLNDASGLFGLVSRKDNFFFSSHGLKTVSLRKQSPSSWRYIWYCDWLLLEQIVVMTFARVGKMLKKTRVGMSTPKSKKEITVHRTPSYSTWPHPNDMGTKGQACVAQSPEEKIWSLPCQIPYFTLLRRRLDSWTVPFASLRL